MSGGQDDGRWKLDAACGQADPLLFELAEGERWTPGRFDEAASYCSRCCVFQQCEIAGEREQFGFWAGADRGEKRYALRQEREERRKAEEDARQREASLVRGD